MREKREILFIMGEPRIREKIRIFAKKLEWEYSIKFVNDYNMAYKIVVEHQVDIMICGPAETGQRMAKAYHFIESVRKLKRYYYTPIILISDVEDPGNYCYRELRCFDVIDPMSVEDCLCKVIERGLCYKEKYREEQTLFLQEQNVIYPVKCRQISHVQAANRAMNVCLKNGKRQVVHYVTLQQFLEVADVPYFLQCSRSGIVNIDYVYNIDYTNRIITMQNSDKLAIGSTYIKRMRENFPSIQEVWNKIQKEKQVV